MTELVVVFGIIASLMAFVDLRIAFFLALTAGFLQDPIRKVLPGEPVYFSAIVVAIVASAIIGAYLRKSSRGFADIPGWNRFVGAPFWVFIGIVFVQSAATMIYTGSAAIAVIGIIAYLFPVLSMLLAYGFASSLREIMLFVKLYLAFSLLMLSGVYLSQLGIEWSALRTVGEELIIYPEAGGFVALPAGFFRAPEIAGWHAAAAVCLMVVMVVSARTRGTYWFAAMLVPFFLGAVALAGRRKFFGEILVFVVIYAAVLIYFRRGSARLHATAIIMAILLGVGSIASGWFSDSPTERLRRSEIAGAQVAEEGVLRIYRNSIDAFQYVVDVNGVFGSGAGTGSQGAQHFGGGEEIVGLAAEGGLAKVLAELGVPGLLILVILLAALARYVWLVLGVLAREDLQLFRVAAGLVAFLGANMVVFVSAHQAYGDPFVLLILGWLFGFVVAAVPISRRRRSMTQRSEGAVVGPVMTVFGAAGRRR